MLMGQVGQFCVPLSVFSPLLDFLAITWTKPTVVDGSKLSKIEPSPFKSASPKARKFQFLIQNIYRSFFLVYESD